MNIWSWNRTQLITSCTFFFLNMNPCLGPLHRLRTPGQEIAFTARPKIHSHSTDIHIECSKPKHILSAISAQIFRFLWFMPSLGVRSPWATTLPWTSIGISAMQNTTGWNYFERSKGGLISIVWQLVIWISRNFQKKFRRIRWLEFCWFWTLDFEMKTLIWWGNSVLM